MLLVTHIFGKEKEIILLRSALRNRCERFPVLNRQKCLMRRKDNKFWLLVKAQLADK